MNCIVLSLVALLFASSMVYTLDKGEKDITSDDYTQYEEEVF